MGHHGADAGTGPRRTTLAAVRAARFTEGYALSSKARPSAIVCGATFADYPGWGDDIDGLATRRSTETAVVVLEPRAAANGATAT